MLLVVLVLALVVGAMVVGLVTQRRNATESQTAAIGGSAPRFSGTAASDPWLDRAGVVVRDGLSAVRKFDEVGLRKPRTVASEPILLDATSRLDDVTHRLAELVTTAPTTMDERVCRNAAVRTRALADALRANAAGPSVVTAHTVPGGAELVDRRDECERALTDLAQHVLLL